MKKTLILLASMLMISPAAEAMGNVKQGDSTLDNSEKVKVNDSVVIKNAQPAVSSVPQFKPRKYKGRVMKENVLVVLMDFSDSKQSTLTKEETDNYYPKYTKAYYNNLFFGETNKGPDGKSYNTINSYYKQASGGSLSLSGQVSGWYRAKKPLTYYGSGDDMRVTELIMEAAQKAAADKNIKMSDYDKYDYYDMDGDGNIYEPDGIIDKFVVIFSGVGESQGGGKFKDNSIWEHVAEVPFAANGKPRTITGTSSKYSKYYKKRLAVAEYGIMAEDSTVGTLSHEFGHMLGLIDEYDISPSAYSHAGEPVRYWSLMSYGADTGKISGMMPVGPSPLAKMDLQQLYGGNWMMGTELNYKNITANGKTYLLDQASIKGVNNDVIKINLPPVKGKNAKGKTTYYQSYYLVEWRSHNGIDKGLGEIYDAFGRNSYGKGMLIWYVDESYMDNSYIMKHPGKSLVGVVDANPHTITTKDGFYPTTDIQIYDAAFNTKDYGNYNNGADYYFKKTTKAQPLFNDKNYSAARLKQLPLPEAGRVLPQLGLKIKVVDQNKDGTVAKIKIYK